MRFGLHVSIAGGVARAPERAAGLGCDCFQVFAGPPRSRARATPSPAEVEEFRRLVRKFGLSPVVVHAGYLLHLVSPRPEVARASRALLARELEIARLLGVDFYILHPGSAGDSREKSVDALARTLSEVTGDSSADDSPAVLIENSAHRSSGIGARFEELDEILGRLGGGDRYGVCFDTAHAVGAGYDLASGAGVRRTVAELFDAVGPKAVRLIHANDSRAPAGSGRDLHERVGAGAVGREGFRALLAEERLLGLPFILETPVDRPGDDRRNLATLRRLAGAGCLPDKQAHNQARRPPSAVRKRRAGQGK